MKRPPLVLAAVRPNAGTEALYRAALQKLIKQMAESMLLHMRAAYREADIDIGFAADANPLATLRRALERWGDHWRARLNAASASIAELFARRAGRNVDTRMQAILRNAGFTVQFKPTEGMKTAYRAVIAEQVGLIKSIPEQYLTSVQSSVWRAVMQGSNLSALSKSIHQHYGVTWRRAAFIARDQNAKARAVLEEQRRSELGIEEAIWLHSHGGKVPRPTHVAMHGKPYKIKQGMWDSAVSEWVWPGTLPNCRCVSRAVVP